ncbi:hypothetical protein [Thalassoroseus pseudoceratinae]|uniref:hypothetical protein n=1 Tax=Thalassoroseus pseudoceratinae TaxID=2713176 RepID=UPI0014217BC8|nr:hypothetical protein [Thalassoroseus pseudoceratinae]
MVKELSALLAGYQPKPTPKTVTPCGKSNPAKKIPAPRSERSVSVDFKTGTLEPWKIVEGKFGHIIGSRDRFFHNNREYNKQETHYLTTLEASSDAEKGRVAGIISRQTIFSLMRKFWTITQTRRRLLPKSTGPK